MFIIDKKRISIILCCLLIGIFAYSYQLSKIDNFKTEELLKTTATPVSGKIIVVDAGHGKPDERIL